VEYINIHNHTEYSNIRLLDSINKTEDLIDQAVKNNYKGVAITDHESVSAHIKAIQHVKRQREKQAIPDDFKLILGNEIYLIDDIDKYKDHYDKDTMKYYHFILLAKNKQGHEQLRKLSSTAWQNSFTQKRMNRVPITYKQIEDVLSQYNTCELIASTACLGSFFAQQILNKNEDSDKNIKDFLEWGLRVFGKGNFFIEIQPSIETPEQQLYNLEAYKIGQKYDIPVIVTTDSHYLTKEDRNIHKAYLNSKEGEREVDDFYGSTYLMTIEEINNYLMIFMVLLIL